MEKKFCSSKSDYESMNCQICTEPMISQELLRDLGNVFLKEDGSRLLQEIMKRLSYSGSCCCNDNKEKVIGTVLDNIEKNIIPARLAKKLICILVSELKNLETSQLVALINRCLVTFNQKQGDIEYLWCIDLLSQLLVRISQIPSVPDKERVISGFEFKGLVIHELLQGEWKNNRISEIASMFIEMPLDIEEHLKIISKLCKSIKNLKPDEIPPIVYQLLHLTKESNSSQLFIALAEYFEIHLYNQIKEEKCHFNEKEVFFEGQFDSWKNVQGIEGTVLYYIRNSAAIFNQKCIKNFVKWLKEVSYDPPAILRPFFITLLLNVSDASSAFQEDVFSVLSSAIVRYLALGEKLSKSAWLASIVDSPTNVEDILNKVVENCFSNRDRIIKGLIELGFALLGFTSRASDIESKDAWAAGKRILVNLFEKYPHVTKEITKTLINRISQESCSIQYTDCLTELTRRKPLNLLNDASMTTQLLGSFCSRLPTPVGVRVLIAILPLAKLSTEFRDSLIIFLRKALFSDDSCGAMAVRGFLEILKNLKITNMRSLSESATQNYVGMTQIYSCTYDTASWVASNEGISLEILIILKQVFEHHFTTKTLLYKGLCDVFYDNFKLGSHILEFLKNRLDIFYRVSEQKSLDFSKIVVHQGSSVVVLEPIGDLLLGMATIAAKIEESAANKSELTEMLDFLCEEMIKSDVTHFDLKKSPENRKKMEEDSFERAKTYQIMAVYEALMGHVLCTWTLLEERAFERSSKLIGLFQGYSRLAHYWTNGCARRKEKEKKLQPHALVTILNFKCAYRLLVVLNGETVDWVDEKHVKVLKKKWDMHKYAFNVVEQLMSAKENLSRGEFAKSGNFFRYVIFMGRIIYVHWIARLSHLKEFDIVCLVAAINCFREILNSIEIHFKKKIWQFLSEIGLLGDGDAAKLKTLLDSFFEGIANVLDESEENEKREEGNEKRPKDETQLSKLCIALASTCSLLIEHLPVGGSHTLQVFQKIKTICKEKKIQNAFVGKVMIRLLLRAKAISGRDDSLLPSLVFSLCDSMPLIDLEMDTGRHENFAGINNKSAGGCLTAICDAVRTSLNEIEWALYGCKAEVAKTALIAQENLPAKSEALVEKEKEICRRLNVNVKVLGMICAIAVPPGSLADAVLKEVGNLYNKLVLTTNYFLYKYIRCKGNFADSKFLKTIKMADHELAKNMYCFTEHIIAACSVRANKCFEKKHKCNGTALKNEILKKTKLIPRVIYEKELFQKVVLKLSKKTRIEIELKNSMARDYRLYAKQVRDIIERGVDFGKVKAMDARVTDEETPPNPKKSKKKR